MTKLPTFRELAENKIALAGPRDKTINIKVAINTARMMVEAERWKDAAPSFKRRGAKRRMAA
jgi:hypothetical protein